jgi:alpha-tubulin suppressor-like RCC1 family protein
MLRPIVRKVQRRAVLLALLVAAASLAVAACVAEVGSEGDEAELELASSEQALVPSQGGWYRVCRKTASGLPACSATACGAGQYMVCNGVDACTCHDGGWGWWWSGYRWCASDEYVECSDRGAGMRCDCARGTPPLLPQQPLGGYPLEVAITSSEELPTTFVRFDDGSLWGWGKGDLLVAPEGETRVGASKPVRLPLSGKVKRITAGARAACALLDDGTVQCLGELGPVAWDEPWTVEVTPGEPLTGAIGLTQAANHACAWRADGRVFCWGESSYKRFGDTSCTDTEEAFEVTAVTDAVQVVASEFNTCFLRRTGKVACVGVNHAGQLGTGSVDNSGGSGGGCRRKLPPTECSGTVVANDVVGLDHVTHLSGGGVGSFCAESTAGTLCWGSNDYQLLALPSEPGVTTCLGNQATPTPRSEGPFHVFGPGNTCTYSPWGRVQCWGSRTFGLLVDGTSGGPAATPVALPLAQNVLSLAIGMRHACYVGDGVIRCWGDGSEGRLGDDRNANSFTTMVSVQSFSVPAATVGSTSSTLAVSGQYSTGAAPCGLFDTGIDLLAGQGFQVSASSSDRWTLGPDPGHVCDANGTSAYGLWNGINYGSLVGTIGMGQPFPLGMSSTRTAVFGGRLKLGIVDSDCANNGGQLNVTVRR